MAREPLTLVTSDGLRLEAELALPDPPHEAWAAAVLAHPNPRDGGNMRSMVPGELITALPAMGVATLRFNFRGVGASEGEMEDGVGERFDIMTAVDTLHRVVEGLALVLCGSSFGADMALSVRHPSLSGWCAMAPPLRDHRAVLQNPVAQDPRPKLLVVAERDQFCNPQRAALVTSDWQNTRIEAIAGADHYFVGRIERVVAICCEFVRSLAADTSDGSPST